MKINTGAQKFCPAPPQLTKKHILFLHNNPPLQDASTDATNRLSKLPPEPHDVLSSSDPKQYRRIKLYYYQVRTKIAMPTSSQPPARRRSTDRRRSHGKRKARIPAAGVECKHSIHPSQTKPHHTKPKPKQNKENHSKPPSSEEK